ncbi:MAG: thioredoxin domain-containing protein [Myxococcota bacterium]
MTDHDESRSPEGDDLPPGSADAPDAGHEPGPAARSSSRLLGVLAFVAALAGGFYIGQVVQRRPTGPWSGYEDRGRYRVELRGHEPQKGPDDALVTIIEFSDYECPFCQRAHEPLMDALEDNDDVRLIFKHMPLPMHAQAIPAARAAWAAQQQGKFWPMHDHLFTAGGSLDEIDDVARSLGLDVERFRTDMLSEAAGEAIEGDRYAAGLLGIGSTPHFVVNGRHIRGALARNHWDTVIEAERAEALALVDAGTPRAAVYDTLMQDAAGKRDRPDRGPDPQRRHAVRLGPERPSLGPEEALVTVVAFSDFQCPYCAKLAPTVRALTQRHPDVRVVFAQLPLPNHSLARPAALAALAAHRQGKFWEMHDALFEQQGALSVEQIDAIAQQLGLDMARFAADREDPTIEQIVAEDEALAEQVGVRGTPASFVNGRFLGGAQPVDAFDTIIAQEREAAQALVDAGTPPAEVFDQLLRQEQGS